MNDAKLSLTQFGIASDHKIVFLNYFAKDIKRCWEMNKIIELIKDLKQDSHFSNASFVINSWPDKKEWIKLVVKNNFLQNVHVFSAQKSFFELPAIMSLCDLVISVDTSIIHLAYALNKPLVGIMRQKNAWIFPKTPKTCAAFTKNRSNWAKHIKVGDVVDKVKTMCGTF
jgi:heptosyltransferase III